MPKLKQKTKEIFQIGAIVVSFKESPNLGLLGELYDKLNIHEKMLKNYRQIIQVKTPEGTRKRRKKKIDYSEGTPIVHLKKGDQPAFIPPNQSDRMEAQSNDFISLKKYEGPSSKKSKIEEISYRPMNIKQVFPNPNRKKK